MTTHQNQCDSQDPHPEHFWGGAPGTRHQCYGVLPEVRLQVDEDARQIFPGIKDFPSIKHLLLKFPNGKAGDETLTHIHVTLHEFWPYFLGAYEEYGPRAADELGLAGQWGDLHRKVKKLKAPLWEGNQERLTRETPRQVLFDIIGHALLAIDMIDREFEGGR